MTILILKYIFLAYLILPAIYGAIISLVTWYRQIIGIAGAKEGLNHIFALAIALPIVNILTVAFFFEIKREPKRYTWDEIHEYIRPNSKAEIEKIIAEHPDMKDVLKTRNEFIDKYKSDFR